MGRLIISFGDLRPDWYANGDLMARALQRELRSKKPVARFEGFPRHWLPLFEWIGAEWRGSITPPCYVPFISGLSEIAVSREINSARAANQLRLLVDVAASAEIVLSETLQRLDAQLATRDFHKEKTGPVTLTTWHSYNRADVRAFDREIASFRQQNPSVMFIPCARARPYHKSQAHHRLMRTARDAGLNVDGTDKIVITSIGPVPEPLWTHEFVQRYDTGIRDLYRLFLQLKTILQNTKYREAWDLMSFAPYSDLVRLAHVEGLIPAPKRISSIRKRNIPLYRPLSASHFS